MLFLLQVRAKFAEIELPAYKRRYLETLRTAVGIHTYAKAMALRLRTNHDLRGRGLPGCVV